LIGTVIIIKTTKAKEKNNIKGDEKENKNIQLHGF